jgi:hypothetical protein
MSKEMTKENINITNYLNYIDAISKGDEEITIFDLYRHHKAINYAINYNLDEEQKESLKTKLVDIYKIDNNQSLSAIINILTEKSINNLADKGYIASIFDIEQTILYAPDLVIKVIDIAKKDSFDIEKYIQQGANEESINFTFDNLTTSKKITKDLLKVLINKGYVPNKDVISELLNQKLDDNVISKINYLVFLGIKFDIKIPTDLLDEIEARIFADDNLIENYTKYEQFLMNIQYIIKEDLLDDLIEKIVTRDNIKELSLITFEKIYKEFIKQATLDADSIEELYLKSIIDLYKLDCIINSEYMHNEWLKTRFINKLLQENNPIYNEIIYDYIGIHENLVAYKHIYFDNIDDIKNKIVTFIKCCIDKDIYVEFKNNIATQLFKILKETYIDEELNFSGEIYINNKDFQHVVQMLGNNRSIKRLILNKQAIGDDGTKYLAEMLKINNTIKEIDLSQNNIKSDGIQCLVEMLKINNTIKEIDLWGNNLSNVDVIKLDKACVGKNIKINFVNKQILIFKDNQNLLFRLYQYGRENNNFSDDITNEPPHKKQKTWVETIDEQDIQSQREK